MTDPVVDAKKFARDGFAVVRGLMPDAACQRMRESVQRALSPLHGPAEFEVDVGYTGAPSSRDAPGGNTPRRLLHAYSRGPVFREWLKVLAAQAHLDALFATSEVAMSQCHHNCIMTKYPGFSSETMWHQDIRYWSFDRPELISAWLALGHEQARNGALWVIPGSHEIELDRGRFDAALFLRRELPENRRLIESAELVQLEPGDLLLFHCRTFHAAGANQTSEVKLSVVSTFHAIDNAPIPGTRSALYPSIPLAGIED
ncbi:MAG: phytanoyl-CoA dioxygenase family protein [Pseudomonadota bacterium]